MSLDLHDKLPPAINTEAKVKVKVKLKFTLEEAMEAQNGSRSIALLRSEPQRWVVLGG